MQLKMLLVILLFPLSLTPQTNNADIWEAFRYFEGSWVGHETGKSGIGKGERTYQFIMGERYLHFKNTSRFEPQKQNPKGEVHQDWTFYSYDEDRDTYVMHQFNIEGYVNQFYLDSLSADGKYMRFELETSQNAPKELRARMTYTIKNEHEFEEVFAMAFPGREYAVWLRNYWKRVEMKTTN